ncbi:MAG: F0F1 ATP synthase subunit B [Opitutales bacterium]|nr:F0F1 ATP synthase subunit B [Opitutales bacterium]
MFSQILASAAQAAEGGNKFTQVTTKFGIETGPLVVQIVSFAVLALVVWYFGFRPLMKTIAERQTKIAEGLQFSDEMKAKLAQSEADYKAKMQQAAVDAAAVIESARKAAKETVEKAAQDAIARAEETEKRAAENIAREREKMLADLKGEVAALVVETTAKLLARDLPAAEKSRLAEAAAKEIKKD